MMKFYLISDNLDTSLGMRLCGIEGIIVHERDEILNALNNACEDNTIGVILMTAKLVALCRDEVYAIKLSRKQPLIVEIPDRHGTGQIGDSLTRYVRESVGIKI